MGVNTGAWGLIAIAAINNCIGSLLVKQSRVVATDSSLVNLLSSPWFIAGLCTYGVNVVLYAKALEKLPVSVAYPVFAGMGFGILALAGGYFFGEKLGFNYWVGLGMIMTGIVVIAR
ncbi:MAG: small multidrug resistance protein [Oscillatoriales cyanobacterium RM2_1_1]|nr:small multidrug resistance protein [Oscillatoriales cyanobacterium SM2_3_0]NJO47928.1 small multidrug resistance protein [Oscillatoriales cyanobacterium RM2_1_1]